VTSLARSIREHKRRWVYRIETFFVLAIVSFAVGRTPAAEAAAQNAGYQPNWTLNRFLWLPYAGSGDMPWELEDIDFLGLGNLILPSILTVLWWTFLTVLCFEMLRLIYVFAVRHLFHDTPPTHDDLTHTAR